MKSNPRRPIASVLCVAVALAVSTDQVLGNRQPDGANDTNYLNYGQQLQTNVFGPTVWIHSVNQNGLNARASGILWDAYHVVTAGHAVLGWDYTNTIRQIGLAKNALSNENQFARAFRVEVHTNWIPSPEVNKSGDILDVTLITLDRPIMGSNAFVTAPPAINSVCLNSGFARVYTAAGGEQPYDGNVRGWTARLMGYGDGFGNYSLNYFRQNFGGSGNGPYPGGAWHGDSGGGVYNATGQLVGMNVAGGNTVTYALRMDVVQPWIEAMIAAEPPCVLSVVPEGNDVRIHWRGVAGSNYVLQAASSLGGTNDFTDLSGPITLLGSRTVATNYLDAGAFTNHPARFYRIRRN